jgi:hypothetical protein
MEVQAAVADQKTSEDMNAGRSRLLRGLLLLVALGGVGAFLFTVPVRSKETSSASPAYTQMGLLKDEAGVNRWLLESGVVETARQRLQQKGQPWSTYAPRAVDRIELVPLEGCVRVRYRQPVLVDTRMMDLDILVLARTILHLYEQHVDDPAFTQYWPSLIDHRFWQNTVGVFGIEADYWKPETEALLKRLGSHPDSGIRKAIARYRRLEGRDFLLDQK